VAQVLSFALMEQVTVQRLAARSEKVAPLGCLSLALLRPLVRSVGPNPSVTSS
jgi:hypothetical protein